MLKRSHKVFITICLAAIFGVFAGNAAAETYTYNFDDKVGETLIVGQTLENQDNWENKDGNSSHLEVGSGNADFSGKYAYGPTSSSDYNDTFFRPNNINWSYSLQDDMDFSVSAKIQTYTGDNDMVSQVGLEYERGAGWKNWILVGIYNGDIKWHIREGTGTSYTDLLVKTLDTPTSEAPVAYEIGVEATAKMNKSYDIQLYYQDVTNGGDKEYYNDGEVFSVTFTNNLSSMFNMLYMRSSNYGTPRNPACVDEICISQVPEPSTLALLGCGLIGLLAYAWRKRK